jgi:hypothetical protein
MPLISKVDRLVLPRLLLRTPSARVLQTPVLLSRQMRVVQSQRASQVPHQRPPPVPLPALAIEDFK